MNNCLLNEFGFLRVAVSSPECKVMDIEFNFNSIITEIKLAIKNNVQIFVCPELSLSTVSGGDLFFQKSIYAEIDNYLIKLREFSKNKNICIIVGFPAMIESKLYNCSALIHNNQIKAIIPKVYLSNEEKRYFSSAETIINSSYNLCGEEIPFNNDFIFQITNLNHKVLCSFSIVSENIYSPNIYLNFHQKINSNLIINLSNYIELFHTADKRKNIIKTISEQFNCAYILANPSSGESTSDSVQSAHSIIAENGQIICETNRLEFNSQTVIADIDIDLLIAEKNLNKCEVSNNDSKKLLNKINLLFDDIQVNKLYRKIDPTPFVPNVLNHLPNNPEEIINIISTALIKRLKAINCTNIVLGLSGGLDSTMALLIADYAFDKIKLNKKGIHCISMPGLGTSIRTKNNAQKLAKYFNTSFREISIVKSVEQHFIDISHPANETSIVYENAQARERTQILMDIANQVNGITIGTGDLSEVALGWSTFNGDHISMYSLNSGIPKTLIRYIISYYSQNKYSKAIKEILTDIIATPISPELLPLNSENKLQQLTEDKIGSYLLNDFFIYNFVSYGYLPKKLYLLANIAFEGKYNEEYIKEKLKSFYHRFFNSQFKRNCVADGPKVTKISFSPRTDWKMASDAVNKLWISQLDDL